MNGGNVKLLTVLGEALVEVFSDVGLYICIRKTSIINVGNGLCVIAKNP